MYLYLSLRDNFACLPEALSKRVGRLDFAMELALSENKKLARENPATVMENLRNQGFHLQLPAEIAVDDILTRIAEQQNRAAQK